MFCTERLAAVCGEARRPVSLWECGERPQREGLSEDRNDDVLEAPPTRVVDLAATGAPDAVRGVSLGLVLSCVRQYFYF